MHGFAVDCNKQGVKLYQVTFVNIVADQVVVCLCSILVCLIFVLFDFSCFLLLFVHLLVAGCFLFVIRFV